MYDKGEKMFFFYHVIGRFRLDNEISIRIVIKKAILIYGNETCYLFRFLNQFYILKISIITPCYNAVAYIEETIVSILNQGYSNLEYIIIDGGSTDGTLEIIQKLFKNIWICKLE